MTQTNMKLIRVNSRRRTKKSSLSDILPRIQRAKLVASESLPGKPTGSAPFSKRKITIISILVFVIIVLLTVIISYVVGIYINHEKYNEVTPLINDFNLTERTPGETDYPPQIPNSPHKIIYRSRWGGRPPLFERPQKVPVKYVIISHTAGAECFNLIDCSKQMQHAQSIHVDGGSPDIGYNFVIGGDANIYVGRGWDNHNFHMNLDTIGISFIGNYVYNTLSAPMVKATQELLKQGIDLGKLTKNYTLVAHNQTWNTQSPGSNVYNRIKYWPHFSPDLLNDIPDISKT